MTIGENINLARKRHKLSLAKLAELADVNMDTLCGWIYRDHHPDILLLCSVADALDMSLDELVGRRTK